jgi:plasmid stabilization system protein ParE
MDYKVTFAARAERDLEDIVRFLAQKNPTAAERLGCSLVDDAISLGSLPRRGVAVQGRPGYRRILRRPWFLIFYRIDETRRLVEIARIWDARQDPDMFTLR